MQKHNGLTCEALQAKGYALQPDGRLRLRNSWKAQCTECRLWFHRLKGDMCWGCYDKKTVAHVRQVVDEQKQFSGQT